MIKGKIAFLTLGCKVNTYETDAMKLLFQNAGYNIVEFSECADIYVVNTCSVTNMADRKSRQMLHRAKKINPDAIVVAAGCYVQSAKEKLEEDPTIDVVIGNNCKSTIVDIVENYRKNKTSLVCVEDLFHATKYEKLSIEDAGEHTRAFIKIQDGCNQFCSYCIIPYTRGRIRSRNLDDILAEVKVLAQNGYKEIVLTGIHLSSYGADFANKNFVSLQGKPLLEVIKALENINGIQRIRLGSLEPRIVTDTFVKELVSYKKVCPHFHLSLQSGCDTTLKRMNRQYSISEYEQGCKILRKYYEHPAITTDVIVGFPGETTEEFEITKEFLTNIAFSQMHIFKFSPRKGTKAETMPEQVPEQQKTERSNILINLDQKLQETYQNYFIGKTEAVLFEEIEEFDGEQYLLGHNERYVKFAVPVTEYTKNSINQICSVVVKKRWKNNLLIGKIG